MKKSPFFFFSAAVLSLLSSCATFIPVYSLSSVEAGGAMGILRVEVEGPSLANALGWVDLVHLETGKVFHGKALWEGWIVFDQLPEGTYSLNNLVFPSRWGLHVWSLKESSRKITHEADSLYFWGKLRLTQSWVEARDSGLDSFTATLEHGEIVDESFRNDLLKQLYLKAGRVFDSHYMILKALPLLSQEYSLPAREI